MKLKTWQKWGIGFGIGHILMCLLFLYLGKYSTGCPSIGNILCMIDAPVYFIGLKFFGRQFYNADYFLFYYLMLFGTLFYLCTGCVFGMLVQSIKKLKV